MRRFVTTALIAALLPAAALAQDSGVEQMRAELPGEMEADNVMIEGLDVDALTDEQVMQISEILSDEDSGNDKTMAIKEALGM